MRSCRTAVIVLNYRGEATLLPCLESLLPTLSASDQVLVVDNGQEGALLATMKARFPRIEVLSLPENGGFAVGMNAGIRLLSSQSNPPDCYWLLNNDTVVTPTALPTLQSAFRASDSPTIFSPLILTAPKGSVWFAGGKISFWSMKTIHFRHFLKEKNVPTEFLTGCALFIPRSVIERLGFLDERYFLYAEDAEYSLRAKRLGIPRILVTAAVIYHAEASEGRNGKQYWLIRSSAEFFLRESRGFFFVWVRFYYILRRMKNWGRLFFCRDHPLAREIERAYTDVSL